MKKIYQIPETELIISEYRKCILGDISGEIGPGGQDSNQGKTFDEGELSIEKNNSSLWED